MKGIIMRQLFIAALAAISASAGAASNVLPMRVHHNAVVQAANQPTVSVTLCVPGHTDAEHCQTIPDILVDTGAAGLRIMSEALKPTLRTAFAPETHQGKTVAECLQYVQSAVWGSVSQADVWLGTDPTLGKGAKPQYGKMVPFHLVGDSRVPAPPKSCNSQGPLEDTVEDFGTNGTIGVSPDQWDNNSLYYTCTASSCTRQRLPEAQQVPNPIGRLPDDNNGVILQLDALKNGRVQESGNGKLILGIGTEDNNKLAPETRIAYVKEDMGMKAITLQNGSNPALTFNTLYYDAFDSGTNAITFPSLHGLSTVYPGKWWYNPSKPEVVSMSVTDESGADRPALFLRQDALLRDERRQGAQRGRQNHADRTVQRPVKPWLGMRALPAASANSRHGRSGRATVHVYNI
ncbi:hypothetical protein CR207_10415 [Chromobacterium violaceum]|nr:DUF3443 family protein [Chromobacterium violaceum]ATP32683.1 hypothetical protein CR207_10415 [Chromobacterium violaceum]